MRCVYCGHGETQVVETRETDEAVLRLGLPMAPSVLLQMVGPRVANHVLHTLHEAAQGDDWLTYLVDPDIQALMEPLSG